MELAETSLLRIVEGEDAEPRVLLLQTVRDFALDELATAGEETEARRSHAAYVAEFVEEVGPQLRGPRTLDAVKQLSAESEHVQAALTWALGTAGPGPTDEQRIDLGLRICVATAWFWSSQGQLETGWNWHARAREVASDEDSAVMARILLWLGIRGAWDAQTEGTAAMLRDAISMAERSGDRSTMAEAASTLAQWHQRRDELEQAGEQFALGLRWATEAGDDEVRASVLHHYAGLLADRGDYVEARGLLEEALAISTRAGNERDVVGRRSDLADLLVLEGRAEEAQRALASLVPDVLRLREPVMSVEVVGSFARTAVALGELRDVVVLASARNVFHAEMGWPRSVMDVWNERIDEARLTLGDAEWEAARNEGEAMTRAQALEYAAGRAAIS
jgi:tetratricopeptide (TPR) repeat protein